MKKQLNHGRAFLTIKSDNRELINELIIKIAKIESLIMMINTDDFFDFDEKIVRNYFATVEDGLRELMTVSTMLHDKVYGENVSVFKGGA